MTTDAHGVTMGNTASSFGYYWGCKIETNGAINLTKVTKHANCTATTCKIYKISDNSEVASASFSGNDATFNVNLAASTQYGIGCAPNTRAYSADGSWYPISGTNVDWISGGYYTGGTWTSDTNFAANVVSIVSAFADTTVNVTALTVSTTADEPVINVEIPGGALSVTATLQEPTISNTTTYAVVVGTGTKGTKIIKTSWPFVSGYDLGTTKIAGRDPYLKPEKSFVPRRYKVGISS